RFGGVRVGAMATCVRAVPASALHDSRTSCRTFQRAADRNPVTRGSGSLRSEGRRVLFVRLAVLCPFSNPHPWPQIVANAHFAALKKVSGRNPAGWRGLQLNIASFLSRAGMSIVLGNK